VVRMKLATHLADAARLEAGLWAAGRRGRRAATPGAPTMKAVVLIGSTVQVVAVYHLEMVVLQRKAPAVTSRRE